MRLSPARTRVTDAGREYLAEVDGPNPPIPRQGNFSVTKHKGHYYVKSFTISEGCLGHETSGDGLPLYDVPTMKVKHEWRFSYKGKARRAKTSGSASVPITLHGQFVTHTKASISLKIDYGQCGTKHLVVHRHS